MRVKANLLAAAALLALMLPAVTQAQENNEHPGGQPPRAQAQRPPAQARPAQARTAQARPGQARPGQAHPGMQQQRPPARAARPAGPPRQAGAPAGRPAMGRPAPGREATGRPAPRPAMAARPRPTPAHTAMRNNWRAAHQNWQVHTVWDRNRYWWRGNPAFSAYVGPRANYYFAPGFGYYAVPGQYWGRHWGIGAFLPLFFLSYIVADYAAYGLPPPPPGAAWVWVNNSVLLVNQSDGYVLDEVGNVW